MGSSKKKFEVELATTTTAWFVVEAESLEQVESALDGFDVYDFNKHHNEDQEEAKIQELPKGAFRWADYDINGEGELTVNESWDHEAVIKGLASDFGCTVEELMRWARESVGWPEKSDGEGQHE